MTTPLSISRWAVAAESAFEPIAAMVRGALVESVHRGAVAVVDRHGRVVGGAGDPNVSLLLRSAAKPFQALAVVESGAARAFSITQEELAVMCGSHAGRAEHVEVVERLLTRLGVPVETLACGPLTHMCSGKHAGMIAMALHFGVPVEGYERVSHPVQQEIARTVRTLLSGQEASGEEPGDRADSRPHESVLVGTDGCGVPMLRTSLRDAAYLLALLAAGAGEGLALIRDAMLAYPALVAGEGRLDTELMRAAGGRLLAKSGAEGIMALAFPAVAMPDGSEEMSFGCIMKVADGSSRVIPALVKPCLEAYGVSVPEEVLAHGRPRSPESLRGILMGQIVSLVEAGDLRRCPPPSSPSDDCVGGGNAISEDGDLKVTIGRGDEKEIIRFLRDEWPPSDEETFGRPLEWIAEPYALIARRRRRVAGVLKGHFTGGVASVDELMVGRNQRDAGLGSMLLTRFEAEAETRRCTRVVLRAVKDSAAEVFYHNRGYRRECVEWFHEFGFDYVRLTRELKPST
jgi:L-asparaginase II/GNAT superfamily N-acetyltransferase